jgi:mRNA-degrading endonuclease toxin of MazEF toxin-antitoxin module
MSALAGSPPDKQRPVLVLTRDSAIGHLTEVILDIDDGMKGPCAVNLHNAVTVAQSRLGQRVGNLGAARMQEVCAALGFSLGCG